MRLTLEEEGKLLEVKGITVGYTFAPVLNDISISLPEAGIVAIIGANGAGKSTTLKTIAGLMRPWQGRVEVDGDPSGGRGTRAAIRKGIVLVPEGRRIFGGLTVAENLVLGAYLSRDRKETLARQERVFQLFPRLYERRKQHGGTLSGGEQQMLALGRGLMSNPRYLLLDEPSMGLAPVIVERILESLIELRKSGLSLLLVEQNAEVALEVADYAYVLEDGQVSVEGTSEALRGNQAVVRAYLGL